MNKCPASHLLTCPVVFVSTRYENQNDIMIATAMFVSEVEPLLAVSLTKGHLTSQLIEKTGGFFTVIAASEGQEDLYKKLVDFKGEEADKFTALCVSALPERPSKPPIPERSAAWFDCQTVAKEEIYHYSVYIARVIDYDDMGKPPLVWHNQNLFTLNPL